MDYLEGRILCFFLSGSFIKSRVVFAVKSPAELITSKPVIFRDITFNEGNGYDKTTGIFTAPVSGTYIFSIQFCTSANDGLGYVVMSKERELKRGYMKDTDQDSCYSFEAVDILGKGDRVWIAYKDPSVLIEDNYRSNYFSGVLVNYL